MARNRKNTKKKQSSVRSIARPSAALLAVLLLLGGGTVAHAATEIGNSATWNVTGASGDITYKAGSVHTITTTGSNVGGGLNGLEITVNSGDTGGRQLIFAGDTKFGGAVTINGYDEFGVPHYGEVTVNSGVTLTVVGNTTVTNTSKLNIYGTHVGNITVMGIDSHINLAGTQQGNVTLYGYDATNSTLTATAGGAGTPTVTGDVNVRLGLVEVQNANMHIQGNVDMYGHVYAARAVVDGKNLQIDGKLDIGATASATGAADHAGSITVQNGGSLTMLPGSTVNLIADTSANLAIIHLDGGTVGATANLGTVNVGTGALYGGVYVDGGTAPAGSTKLTVQNINVGTSSQASIYNNGVLEVTGSLGTLNGTINVRDNGQIITHNASLNENAISGQGGTGLALWNGGTWSDTGTITVKAVAGSADLTSQGVISALAIKGTDAGGVTPAALTMSTGTGSQVVKLTGDGSGNFLTATSLTVGANSTLSLAGVGGTTTAPITVSSGTVDFGKGTWTLSDATTGLAVTGGNVMVGDAAKPAELSNVNVAKASLSGAGIVTVNANGTLTDSGTLSLANTSQLNVNGGTANITGAASTAGTAKIIVDSNGTFTAGSLAAGSTGGVALNTGTFTVGSLASTAANAFTVNGGTASLGAVTSSAAGGLSVNGGTVTSSGITSSAASGLAMTAGSLTTDTLKSTVADGVALSGGLLTVKNNLDLTGGDAVLVNGTGHLTLQPAATVTGTGTLGLKSAGATIEGAWGTLIVSSDGSNKSGTFTKEQAFLDITSGTLLLTGLSSFTLDDLAAARKNAASGTDIGPSLLIASTGTFDSAGTKLTSIDTDFAGFTALNGGLFDTSLVNAQTNGTDITINGGGTGNQNVGFKDVDLKTGGLLISKDSALTVIQGIADAGVGKDIVLDKGTLTLGNPGMANSGGTISAGITTTASTPNTLNVTNGTFEVKGSVGHDAAGTLAVNVDKGILNVDTTLDATSLDVTNAGAVNATGSITAGTLTDGITPGKVDNGTITTKADMTVTSNGIDAVNGSVIGVTGTLNAGAGNVAAEGGSKIDAGTLVSTGNVTATGVGSHIGVTNDYTAAPAAVVAATSGGDLNFGGNLTVSTPFGADAATIEVGKNLTLNALGLTADHAATITVGGNVVNAGAVLADHNSLIDVTGNLAGSTVTAQNGGDIKAGSLTATGAVLVDGVGSTLGVTGALNEGTNTLTVQNNAVATVGSIASVGNILVDNSGTLTSKGDVASTGTVTAQSGGDVSITGKLDAGGNIGISGTGSTLNVTGAVDTTGNIAVSGGGTTALGPVTKAVDITATGTGSAVTITGDVTNSGTTKADTNGTISVTGELSSGGDITADAGIVTATGSVASLGAVLATNGGLISGENLGAATVTANKGGDIMLDKTLAAGAVVVDGAGSTLGTGQGAVLSGSLTVSNDGKANLTGDSSAVGVTANTGGDIMVTGKLTSTLPVAVDGAGSTLGVTGALDATGQTVTVQNSGTATVGGAVTSGAVLVDGTGSALSAAQGATLSGSLSVSNDGKANLTGDSSAVGVTANTGGDVTVTGKLTSTGTVLVDGAGSTLGVTGALDGTGQTVTVQNGGTATVGGALTASTLMVDGGASVPGTTKVTAQSLSVDSTTVKSGAELDVTAPVSLSGTQWLDVNGGVVTSFSPLTVGGTARVTIENKGTLTAPSLTTSAVSGVTLTDGVLTTSSVNTSASKGLTIDGGSASLGTVTSSATDGLYITKGEVKATDVTSTATGGVTMSGGTLDAPTLTSNITKGVDISGGTLTVSNTLTLGAADAVYLTGGKLVVGGTVAASGGGSIGVNGALATLQGSWDTLLVNSGGTYVREQDFVHMTQGTLLLTGRPEYTLADLIAARTNGGGTVLGVGVLFASDGTLVNGGTPVPVITADDPILSDLQGGLFGTKLEQTTPGGTTTIGSTQPQNVGFSSVALDGGPLDINKGSSLTVIGDISGGVPGSPITLADGSTLTLGNPGMANSGGTVSTSITTTNTPDNKLNVVAGDFTVKGDVITGAGGVLDVTVDKGTLTADNVTATSLDVTNSGTLHSLGNITAGTLTDGANVGTVDKGTILADGNMTVADGGINATNASKITVVGTLTAGNGGDVTAAGGSTIDAGTLAATGDLLATGTGSHIGVAAPYSATGTLTADKSGELAFGDTLSTKNTVLADSAGLVSVTKDLTTTAAVTANNGGTVSVGGDINSTSTVLASNNGIVNVTNDLGADTVAAQTGGDIKAGSLTAVTSVTADGAGSTITVTGALTAPTVNASNDGDIKAGTLATTGAVKADGTGSTIDVTGALSALNVTASNGGDVLAGTLTSTGPVSASGAGSTLNVTGALTATGQDVSVTGGAQSTLGSIAAAKDVTVSGTGGSPAVASTLTVHGDVTNSGNVLVDAGKLLVDNNGNLNTTGSVTSSNGGTLQVVGNVSGTDLTANGGTLAAGGNATGSAVNVAAGGAFAIGGTLTSTGPIVADGAGSLLAVAGAVIDTGQNVSITGGAQGQMGSLAAQDVSVSGAGGGKNSTLVVQNDLTASRNVNVDTGTLSTGGSLSAVDVTLTKGGTLTAAKDVTATGAVSLAGASTLNTGGMLTAPSVTATGGSALNTGGTTVSGPVSLTGGSSLTSTGALVTTGAGQAVTVGTSSDTAGSVLDIASHSGTPVSYSVASGTAASPSALRIANVANPLNDTIVAGPNSLVAMGPNSTAWVQDQVAASGAAPASTVALSAPVTLGTTGQVLAGDKYSADGKWNGAATADNYGLALRGASLLVADTTAVSGGPLLTLGAKNTVLVEPTASMRFNVDTMQAGKPYTLVAGLAASKAVSQDGTTYLADGTALSLKSMTTTNVLVGVDGVRLSGNTLVLNTKAVDAGSVLPGVSGPTAGMLNNIATNYGFNTQSDNAGIRFVSRVLDNRYANDLNRAARTIEGAQQLAVSGGVPGSTLGVVQGTVGALSDRTSMASPLMRPQGNSSGLVETRVDDKGQAPQDDDLSGVSGGSGETLKNGIAVWAMPIYQNNSVFGMPAQNMSTGYTSNLGGLALGSDYTFDNMFRVGVALGLGGGYAQSTGDFNNTDTNFNFWSAHVYGGWNVHNFGLTADVGYSSSYSKVKQNLNSNLGMADLNSDVTSSAISAGVRGEYKFATSIVDIIPHVGVRYTGLTVDGYDVKSGGTVFSVESNTQNIWTFPVGVTFMKSIETESGWVFKPRLDLGITPAAGDVKAKSRATIPGVRGAAELESQVVDYMSYDAALGFEMQKGGLSLGLNYQIQASEHRTAQGVFGTIRYEF